MQLSHICNGCTGRAAVYILPSSGRGFVCNGLGRSSHDDVNCGVCPQTAHEDEAATTCASGTNPSHCRSLFLHTFLPERPIKAILARRPSGHLSFICSMVCSRTRLPASPVSHVSSTSESWQTLLCRPRPRCTRMTLPRLLCSPTTPVPAPTMQVSKSYDVQNRMTFSLVGDPAVDPSRSKRRLKGSTVIHKDSCSISARGNESRRYFCCCVQHHTIC